jgi:hypothetical protein
MKKYLLFIMLCGVSVALFFGGCGGTGAPGSTGSQDTGITPTVTVITHSTVSGNQGDEWEIDDIQDVCSGGTLEKWGNDYANITFQGQLLNPNTTSPSTLNNTLYITAYSVAFLSANPSNPTIDSFSGGSQGGITIVTGPTGPFSFLIFSTGMKEQLVKNLNTINSPPNFPLQYNMEIVLYGQDTYGNNFTVGPIIRLINIADFDRC